MHNRTQLLCVSCVVIRKQFNPFKQVKMVKLLLTSVCQQHPERDSVLFWNHNWFSSRLIESLQDFHITNLRCKLRRQVQLASNRGTTFPPTNFQILKVAISLRLTYLINNIRIIQLESPLFNQLHASNSNNHLRTTRNPENCIHIHLFGAVNSLISTDIRKYLNTVFVDCYEYCARDFGLGRGYGWTCRSTCCCVNCWYFVSILR
jgi:hypothetical protein